MQEVPPLPPGFELEAPANIPPLPPGFELEAPRVDDDRVFQRDGDEALYREILAENEADPLFGVGPPVPNPPTPKQDAVQRVQSRRAREAEQRAFDETRTPVTRALDTAAFVPSAVVRTLTRGEHGLGDVVGLVNQSAGRAIAEREANFARANKDELELLANIGDVAIGVPALSTMGAPARSLATIGNRVANKPLPRKAVKRGQLRDERLGDLQAFKNSDVEPFAPALTDAGLAGTVKQLSEAPLVGAPVKRSLERAIGQTRDAGERIAQQYGSARTYRDAGNIAQEGLERFRSDRTQRVRDRDADAPTPDSELTAIIRSPARSSSIKTKTDALYERAWRGIPEDMARGRTRSGQSRYLGAMSNTMEVLRGVRDRNMSMINASKNGEKIDKSVASPVRAGVAGQIADDIMSGKWRGNLQAMRDVRSHFRRLASGMPDTERNTLQVSDFKRIQSAMTRDMIALLERNASSAKGAKEAGNIRRAIHDFRRADQFTRASAKRMESVERLYGVQSAEQLGINIMRDAMGGRKGGNLHRLTALRRSLRDEEWGDVTSGVIREMGRPLGSARGATEQAGFSVQSFVTNWNNMSREGRGVLFRNPANRELGTALKDFARVADRMANFEALANTSRTSTNALGMGGLLSVITAAQQAVTGNLQGAATAGSAAAGMWAFSKFMTSPAYVRWLTRTVELSAQEGRSSPSLRAQARRLARLAEKEPDGPVQELMSAVAAQLETGDQ